MQEHVALAPWPFVKQRNAARMLGVSVEHLQGLANNPIPAVRSKGKSGSPIWLFEKAAIERILSAQETPPA